MDQLREFDVVRVARLERVGRQFRGTDTVMRPPQVGDMGTIVGEPGAHDAGAVTVEMVDGDGMTVWLADFARHELEFVHRP
jgi:hypothetical protein